LLVQRTIIKENREYAGQSSESPITLAGGDFSFDWNFKSDAAYDFQIQITATIQCISWITMGFPTLYEKKKN